MLILATNLANLREMRGLKQHDLAAAARIHVEKIRAYEQRRRFPGAEEFQALATALNVDPADLLRVEGSPIPKDIADALSECGPERLETIRALLRGYGLIPPASQAPARSSRSSGEEKP